MVFGEPAQHQDRPLTGSRSVGWHPGTEASLIERFRGYRIVEPGVFSIPPLAEPAQTARVILANRAYQNFLQSFLNFDLFAEALLKSSRFTGGL